MSGVELKANDVLKGSDVATAPAVKRRSVFSSLRVLPALFTVAAVCAAAALGWQAWQYYMGSPWTRDGTVRAYVVKVAPQVAGEIVQLPIVDNQFVHKGDLLMLIDPRNYSIAVRQAQAAVEQTKATADNANAEMTRRLKLTDIAVTMEERQTYVSQAATAEATYQSALASLDQARINLKRTEVRSPVNGYVTNLTAQLGDYANVGALQLSVVNSDSYWVDAYFEETALGRIHEGDAATIKLMGYTPLLRGRVQGLARGINVPNATPDAAGLASVNPIFTFVRLAQRVPVRIHIDEVPKGVELVAGLTATVQIEPYKAPQPAPLAMAAARTSGRAPAEAAPSQALSHPTPRSTEAEGGTQAPLKASQRQKAPPAAPDAGASGLAVSAPLSAEASRAAAAADADLKTLEEQIAANPPSGTPAAGGAAGPPTMASSPPPGQAGAAAPTDAATSQATQLLSDQAFDRTLDLEPTTRPPPRRHAPETLRRRGWRHWERR